MWVTVQIRTLVVHPYEVVLLLVYSKEHQQKTNWWQNWKWECGCDTSAPMCWLEVSGTALCFAFSILQKSRSTSDVWNTVSHGAAPQPNHTPAGDRPPARRSWYSIWCLTETEHKHPAASQISAEKEHICRGDFPHLLNVGVRRTRSDNSSWSHSDAPVSEWESGAKRGAKAVCLVLHLTQLWNLINKEEGVRWVWAADVRAREVCQMKWENLRRFPVNNYFLGYDDFTSVCFIDSIQGGWLYILF